MDGVKAVVPTVVPTISFPAHHLESIFLTNPINRQPVETILTTIEINRESPRSIAWTIPINGKHHTSFA